MIISKNDLKGTKYKIVKTYEKVNLNFSEIIDDMMVNEYSKLENYFKDNFDFIKFKDEEIIVKDEENNAFIVFGRNHDGFFAINNANEVWLMPFASSNYENPIFVNSSLHQFRCCYCLLLSILFYLCAKTIDENELKQIAIRFKTDIKSIDNNSLSSLFYQNYIFSIENSENPIHFTPIHYIKTNRHIV